MAVIWVEVQVVENFDSSMEVMKVLLNFIPFEFYGFGINDRLLSRLCWGADGDKLRIRGRNHGPGHIFVLCVCVTEFVLVIVIHLLVPPVGKNKFRCRGVSKEHYLFW